MKNSAKNSKNKKSNTTKIAAIAAICIVVAIVASVIAFNLGCRPVSSDDTIVAFQVEEGDTYSSLGAKLKDQGLIRSAFCYKILTKLSKPENLYTGYYPIKKSMDLTSVVSVIANGQTFIPNAKMITFQEGLNMTKVAALIAENTTHTSDEVYALLKNESYIDSLIEQYWFLTDEIKNSKIYYPIEGYLFPDTYEVDPEGSIEDIFSAMLNRTDSILSEHKTEIESNPYGYSVHQILTLASVVELEAANSDDRAGVAGVFYNRLKQGMALGSDVTTYYGAKVDMAKRDLYQSELDAKNGYNTRHSSMAGKLPVGPICDPGQEAILAAINPTSHDYLFFVADKNKKTYFSKTNSAHEKIIKQLKDDGLWYEYDK